MVANIAPNSHTDACVPPCFTEYPDLSSSVEEEKPPVRAFVLVPVQLHFEDRTQLTRERDDSGLVIFGRSRVEQDLAVSDA
jgi:hypothetical protein